MNLKQINLIYKEILVEMFETEFSDIIEFLLWTDMIIWNKFNLHGNKRLNNDRKLMNYYVQIIKKLMLSPIYIDSFKDIYRDEKLSDIAERLRQHKFDSFLYVLDRTNILKILIK